MQNQIHVIGKLDNGDRRREAQRKQNNRSTLKADDINLLDCFAKPKARSKQSTLGIIEKFYKSKGSTKNR